jgi:hypothetical protein
MNLVEFICFLVLAALVILCSGGLGQVLGIPAAAAVIPISAFLVLLLRVLTRVPNRALLVLASLLVLVARVSMGLALTLGLRESIRITPVAAGLVFIAIQSKVLTWRRVKKRNTTKYE